MPATFVRRAQLGQTEGYSSRRLPLASFACSSCCRRFSLLPDSVSLGQWPCRLCSRVNGLACAGIAGRPSGGRIYAVNTVHRPPSIRWLSPAGGQRGRPAGRFESRHGGSAFRPRMMCLPPSWRTKVKAPVGRNLITSRCCRAIRNRLTRRIAFGDHLGSPSESLNCSCRFVVRKLVV